MSAPSRWLVVSLPLLFACACATMGDDVAPMLPRAPAQPEVVLIPPYAHRTQVQLSNEEFLAAVPWLVASLRVADGASASSPRTVPASWERPDEAMRVLLREYRRWCRDRQEPADCLGLLGEGGNNLGPEGRRTWALRLALAPTMDSMRTSLREAGSNPSRLLAMLTVSIAAYLLLFVIPEPISKVVASVITVYLTAYLGADTLISLAKAWLQLREDATEGSTLGELRAAGQRFGAVLGDNGARVLIMTFCAVLGHTANRLIRGLPGLQQASFALKAESGGMDIGELVGRVQTAAVTGRGVTLVLAPAAVVQMSGNGHAHHISTNKNDVSDARGGPWTPRFKEIFDKAGMSLDDAENIVNIKGHQGPHPEEYHDEVLRRLRAATGDCTTMLLCRGALVRELRGLAEEIATPGTRLNKLVTRTGD